MPTPDEIKTIMALYKTDQIGAEGLISDFGYAALTPASLIGQSARSYTESNKTEENYSPLENQKPTLKFPPKKESESDIVDELLKEIEEAEKESQNP